jgi:hypothetical protein
LIFILVLFADSLFALFFDSDGIVWVSEVCYYVVFDVVFLMEDMTFFFVYFGLIVNLLLILKRNADYWIFVLGNFY